MRHALGLALLLSLVPALASAQAGDSAQGSIKLPATDSALRLPADRSSELTSWLPGGSFDIDGAAAWHGRTAEGFDRSIDGILWNSLIRSSGANGRGATVRRLEPAFNGIGRAWLRSGAYGADQSVGGVGALGYTTLGGGDKWSVTGTAESEEPLRADGGQGISRFEAAGGGPLGKNWRVRAAALLTGRRFAPTGVDYNASPYFVPTGIDTTITYAHGSPTDSLTGFATDFGSTSSVPYSARSNTDLYGRVDGMIGTASVWARYLLGNDAERAFVYQDVSNGPQTFARNGSTQDLGAGVTLPAGQWRFDAALAWQEDHTEDGPIEGASEADSRDPTFGIMLGGIPLQYTMDNFPVDDELLWNYRLNTPGSRRTPYDLENTAQYALIDRYRNNAYGLLGFSESGGPMGTLMLYRDKRWAVTASARHPLGSGTLAFGGEVRQHDIQYYTHQLASQALSDVWAAKPTEQALFAEWNTGGSRWRLRAGLRMDRFATGARRPRMIPRLSSAATYVDPVSGDTLRWSMADAGDSASWYSLNTDPDEAHVAFSPRIAVEGSLANDLTGHLSLGRLARTPDLSKQLSGINTDLGITNSSQVYGTDYGHEITDLIEGGIRYGEADRWVDVTLFMENNLKTARSQFVSKFDPNTLGNTFLNEERLTDGATYTGITASGRVPANDWLRFSGALTYISTGREPHTYAQDDELVRPTTLTLAAEAVAPGEGALRGFGGIVTWRQASGMARAIYTGVGPFDSNVRDENLPSWKTLDLRITKAFDLGGSPLTIYLDARNLLNAENLVRAFSEGNATSNQSVIDNRFTSDSNDYAREALASGRYNAGSIDLTMGRGGCGGWVTASGEANPVNCIYLITAESRFGNGDLMFDQDEQARASLAYLLTQASATRFSAAGRSLRIGAQVAF